jgi:8-oxo-dGTP diphosphatase
MKVRTAAKAIIIQNGQLLCTKNRDDHGFFYMLPGGGQEPGENMIEALQRECREEISAEVIVGQVLFVRDYIEKNHHFARPDSQFHQLEVMFKCQLVDETPIGNGSNPDPRQVGVEWLPLDKLSGTRFYPNELKPALQNGAAGPTSPIYLGDIN